MSQLAVLSLTRRSQPAQTASQWMFSTTKQHFIATSPCRNYLYTTSSRSLLRASTYAPRYLNSALQTRLISTETKDQLTSLVASDNVVVFIKGTKDSPMCGFSRAVVQILGVNGVSDFKTFNVLEDESVRNGIKEFTNWPTIPQVFIKGEFVGGCDIIMSMHQSGELEKMLIERGIVAAPEETKV